MKKFIIAGVAAVALAVAGVVGYNVVYDESYSSDYSPTVVEDGQNDGFYGSY